MHTHLLSRLRPLACLLPLVGLPVLAHAQTDELFVGDANHQLLQGAPGEMPTAWSASTGVPVALLAEGNDLLIGTEDGQIVRMNRSSGAVISSYSTGFGIRDVALYESRLLVGADDSMIHLLDIDSGLETGSLDPGFSISAVEVVGDRVYCGSTDGRIAFANIGDDVWSPLVSQLPGAVTDIAFGGSVMYYTSENSLSVFIMNTVGSANPREYVMPSFPTTLAVSGSSLLVGVLGAGIYDYDIPSFATLGFVWLSASPISMFVNHTVSVGSSYCVGDTCPCANNSPQGGCANSTGAGAELVATGSSDLSLDDLDLQVNGVPADRLGLFFMAQSNQAQSFGDGRLCVGGSGAGLFRFPVRNSGSQGLFEELGVVAHSRDHFGVLGGISAGSTWNFQAWYRDPQGTCSTGFNTSNAWTVSFSQ